MMLSKTAILATVVSLIAPALVLADNTKTTATKKSTPTISATTPSKGTGVRNVQSYNFGPPSSSGATGGSTKPPSPSQIQTSHLSSSSSGGSTGGSSSSSSGSSK
jgi:hypothetical protein